VRLFYRERYLKFSDGQFNIRERYTGLSRPRFFGMLGLSVGVSKHSERRGVRWVRLPVSDGGGADTTSSRTTD